LAVIFAVNVGVFMVALSCLPDLPKAGLTFDAGDVNPDVIAVVPPQCGNGVVELDAGEQCDPGDAGAVGCVSCRVTCEDGGFVDDATGHCYFIGGGPNGQYDTAGKACQAGAAHVVTFVSEAEYTEVLTWAQRLGVTSFWVGLDYDIPSAAWQPPNEEPGWSSRCPGCYAHVDAGSDFFPLLRDAGSPKACVVAGGTIDDPWFGIPCMVPGALKAPSVVCEREPAGATEHACNGGTCITVRGAGRYLYITVPATAQQAYENCQLLGARPVVFETHEEREELARELLTFVPKTTQSIWVGLSRANGFSQNGNWTWADDAGVNAYPLEWGNGQPQTGFTWAYMSLSLMAYDIQLVQVDPGTLKLPYICEF
jgi:hypothetical protein